MEADGTETLPSTVTGDDTPLEMTALPQRKQLRLSVDDDYVNYPPPQLLQELDSAARQRGAERDKQQCQGLTVSTSSSGDTPLEPGNCILMS